LEGDNAPEETETARLRDKLGHVQPAHDTLAHMAKQMRERYPNDFDDKGNLVEKAATEYEPVLHAGRPAGGPAAAPNAAETGRRFGFDALQVDPEEARLGDLNARALAELYENENLVGPVRTIVMDAMAQMGLTPGLLQQMSQGGGGMDETQWRETATEVSRQQILAHQDWQAKWNDQVAACKTAFPDLLGKLIDWPDTPKMTIEKALSRICKETGEENPHWALLKHKVTGPVANQMLINQKAQELAAQMIAKGAGMQLTPGGAGFPGPATAGSNDIEDIGGSREPLRR